MEEIAGTFHFGVPLRPVVQLDRGPREAFVLGVLPVGPMSADVHVGPRLLATPVYWDRIDRSKSSNSVVISRAVACGMPCSVAAGIARSATSGC